MPGGTPESQKVGGQKMGRHDPLKRETTLGKIQSLKNQATEAAAHVPEQDKSAAAPTAASAL